MKTLLKLETGNHIFKVNGIIRINVRSTETSIVYGDGTTCKYDELPNIFRSHRYYCSCPPGLMDDTAARFARQVVLELPDGSGDKARRLREGLSPDVCVDPCIVGAIKDLWRQGIETTGCCCGHNDMRGWVSVHEKDYVRMFELGYEQRPVEMPEPGVVHGLYAFYL